VVPFNDDIDDDCLSFIFLFLLDDKLDDGIMLFSETQSSTRGDTVDVKCCNVDVGTAPSFT
jgi:hypothetical protein